MTQQSSPAPETDLRCSRHPHIATNLRCSKCSDLICPQCLVHTPVGARCPDCAQLQTLPQFQVSLPHYLRAVLATLGVSLAAGVIWGLFPLSGVFISVGMSLLTGYTISGVVNRMTNRRQSLGLKLIAGCGVVVAYLIARMSGILLAIGLPSSLAALAPYLALAFSAALGGAVNPLILLVVIFSAFFAASRIG